MRGGPNRDILGQSYDTDQLDALFESESGLDQIGNGAGLETLGIMQTTPNIE